MEEAPAMDTQQTAAEQPADAALPTAETPTETPTPIAAPPGVPMKAPPPSLLAKEEPKETAPAAEIGQLITLTEDLQVVRFTNGTIHLRRAGFTGLASTNRGAESGHERQRNTQAAEELGTAALKRLERALVTGALMIVLESGNGARKFSVSTTLTGPSGTNFHPTTSSARRRRNLTASVLQLPPVSPHLGTEDDKAAPPGTAEFRVSVVTFAPCFSADRIAWQGASAVWASLRRVRGDTIIVAQRQAAGDTSMRRSSQLARRGGEGGVVTVARGKRICSAQDMKWQAGNLDIPVRDIVAGLSQMLLHGDCGGSGSAASPRKTRTSLALAGERAWMTGSVSCQDARCAAQLSYRSPSPPKRGPASEGAFPHA
ncbi:hypothetical protein AK812_SmicGene32173 [Symbiodinium microadriaticum]|uniref:Uncharacterized protein n=1 Tax=Symbiodinium microadriaticum TaxID=2951 RepID=A0A1Q9CUX9_SYMMI|nr:hypothetical protein AK812_SmicGene32173 [Symbiodinium microadriaticum]